MTTATCSAKTTRSAPAAARVRGRGVPAARAAPLKGEQRTSLLLAPVASRLSAVGLRSLNGRRAAGLRIASGLSVLAQASATKEVVYGFVYEYEDGVLHPLLYQQSEV